MNIAPDRLVILKYKESCVRSIFSRLSQLSFLNETSTISKSHDASRSSMSQTCTQHVDQVPDSPNKLFLYYSHWYPPSSCDCLLICHWKIDRDSLLKMKLYQIYLFWTKVVCARLVLMFGFSSEEVFATFYCFFLLQLLFLVAVFQIKIGFCATMRKDDCF